MGKDVARGPAFQDGFEGAVAVREAAIGPGTHTVHGLTASVLEGPGTIGFFVPYQWGRA